MKRILIYYILVIHGISIATIDKDENEFLKYNSADILEKQLWI
jgi:hypothetical protein